MTKIIRLSLIAAAIALLPVARAADAAVKPDPLDTCFISGEKLGEMGKPVVTVYQGQELKFCCRDCKKEFDKDPAAGMKKFNAAVAAAKK